MNLKKMINAALGELSFLEKAAFASSADVDDKQMVHIANRVVREVREFYDWSALASTHHIAIVDGQTRYDLPDDYFSVVSDSAWETNGSRKCDFPVPKNRWFMYKFSSLTDAGTIRARLYGNQIELHEPSVTTGFDLEYITKYLVEDTANTPKEMFTDDTDLFVLDDDLMIKGIQAYWTRNKMMPMAPDMMAEFMDSMRYNIGRDNSGQTIGGTGPRVDRRSPYYPLFRRS